MKANHVKAVHKRLPVFLSLTAGFFLAGPGAAEPPRDRDRDLIDQVRREEQVAAQKLEADVRQSLRDAEHLPAAQAVTRLKLVQAALEEDTLLAPDRRAALKRMLKDRIRMAETDAAPRNGAATVPLSARRADEDRKAALVEKEKITQAFNDITNARKLQKENERKVLGAYQDIAKSATPASNEVEFPRDWKERTKNRTTAIKLTDKEKTVLKALNTEVAANFKNSRFEDVLNYFRARLDVDIIPDPEALKESEIGYDTPVTLNLKRAPARAALKALFANLGMSYVLKDECIYVVSAQKAREMMVVRSYYVGDILASMGSIATSPLAHSFPVNPPATAANQAAIGAQIVQNANVIVEMIKSNVDASSWRDGGGNGTITFHAPSMSLVIKQSAEVHAQLANGGFGK